MNDYALIGFRKSQRAKKKYDAILKHKETGKVSHVPFGDTAYQHYKDTTPNKLYSHLNHGDANRRRLYRMRHQKDLRPGYYSPGYFSYYRLW